MDFELGSQREMLRQTVRAFAEREVAPRAAAADEAERLPPENFAGLAKLGLMGMALPEDLGGSGLDMLSCTLVVEELARACASTALSLGVHTVLASHFIHRNADDAQRRRFLPAMATGEKIGAWALTEPGAGSDALSLSTRAARDGRAYLLNGRKMFITNGSIADVVVVFAKTKPELGPKGISTFVLERGMPGFAAQPPFKKMGCRASPTCELVLENVRVPEENRLGAEGDGLRQLMEGLNYERTVLSGYPLGVAQAAFECALKYAKERQQFGKPIGQFQLIQEMLADMHTELLAARLMVYRAAAELDAGRLTNTTAAAAKLFAAGMGVRVAMNAVQVLGGYGYMREFPAERYLRDAKLAEIGAGTSQIMKLVIGRELMQ
ncbi:MAG: acyl-CoA dehydrogenase family protein [Planctomycetes bacterium]|nr:acyl-CoA dehydrogenase family protein [Planctomycetota bacterium]